MLELLHLPTVPTDYWLPIPNNFPTTHVPAPRCDPDSDELHRYINRYIHPLYQKPAMKHEPNFRTNPCF